MDVESHNKNSNGDKLMEKLSNKVKELNKNQDIINVIIEDEYEIIANSLYESCIKKGGEPGAFKEVVDKQKEIAKICLRKRLI